MTSVAYAKPEARERQRLAPRNLSQRAHRIIIGVLGLLLPFLVYVIAGLRETTGLTPWKLLDSVSAYYYTGAIGVFVGVLFAMALFLISYPGYEDFVWDRVFGRVGGVMGLGVALFPTGAPKGLAAPSWWQASTGTIHYVCAVSLFSCFAVFALWLFRRSDTPDKSRRPKDKRVRDAICLVSGIVIVVSMAGAGIAGLLGSPIILPESAAILAFSVSWLAKGQAFDAARAAVRGVTG